MYAIGIKSKSIDKKINKSEIILIYSLYLLNNRSLCLLKIIWDTFFENFLDRQF